MLRTRAIVALSALASGAAADISNVTATTTVLGIYNMDNSTIPTATFTPRGTLTAGERPAATPAGLICHDDRKPYPCFGIERRLGVAGIDWFCAVFRDHVFNFPSNNIGSTYYYTPSSSNLADQGTIRFTISIIGDQCTPVVVMSQEACRQWLRIPIDQCDTEGVNNKHGGCIDHGCLRYEFQPNPLYWLNCD